MLLQKIRAMPQVWARPYREFASTHLRHLTINVTTDKIALEIKTKQEFGRTERICETDMSFKSLTKSRQQHDGYDVSQKKSRLFQTRAAAEGKAPYILFHLSGKA
jgi:hypothetical protein